MKSMTKRIKQHLTKKHLKEFARRVNVEDEEITLQEFAREIYLRTLVGAAEAWVGTKRLAEEDSFHVVPIIKELDFDDPEDAIDLSGTNLSGSVWKDCELGPGILFKGIFGKKNSKGIKKLERQTDLSDCAFEGSTKFISQDLSGVNLGTVELSKELFEKCRLAHAKMDITGSIFVSHKPTLKQLQNYVKLRARSPVPKAAQGSFSDYLQSIIGRNYPERSIIIADLSSISIHAEDLGMNEGGAYQDVPLDFSRSDLRQSRFIGFRNKMEFRDCDMHYAMFEDCKLKPRSDFRGSEMGMVLFDDNSNVTDPMLSISSADTKEEMLEQAVKHGLIYKKSRGYLERVFQGEVVCDPCYIRGSSDEEMLKPSTYHALPGGKDDVFEYRDYCQQEEVVLATKSKYADKHQGRLPKHDYEWVKEIKSFSKFLHEKYGDDFPKGAIPDLKGLDLGGEKDTSILPGIRFNGGRTNLKNCNFGQCNFGRCSLVAVDLDGSNFENSNFSGANLKPLMEVVPVPIPQRTFPYVRFKTEDPTSFKGADLTGCCFRAVRAESAILRGAKVDYLHAVDAKISHLDGEEMRGEYVNFSRGSLRAANIKKAVLPYANFGRVKAPSMKAEGADLRGASLRDAGLAGADFTEANLMRADFAGAVARNCEFKKANLEKARTACLAEGAVMLGARVADAALADPIIPEGWYERLFGTEEEDSLSEHEIERAAYDDKDDAMDTAYLYGADYRGGTVRERVYDGVEDRDGEIQDVEYPDVDIEDAIDGNNHGLIEHARERMKRSNPVSRSIERFGDLGKRILGGKPGVYFKKSMKQVADAVANPRDLIIAFVAINIVVLAVTAAVVFPIFPAVIALEYMAATVGTSLLVSAIGSVSVFNTKWFRKISGSKAAQLDESRDVALDDVMARRAQLNRAEVIRGATVREKAARRKMAEMDIPTKSKSGTAKEAAKKVAVRIRDKHKRKARGARRESADDKLPAKAETTFAKREEERRAVAAGAAEEEKVVAKKDGRAKKKTSRPLRRAKSSSHRAKLREQAHSRPVRGK